MECNEYPAEMEGHKTFQEAQIANNEKSKCFA
jgi:hypothetical protein